MASSYIPGYINSMDVCGFGFTTQSAMFWQSQHAALDVHQGITCDGCGATPLRGIRWHCASCADHDICNDCKKRNAFAGHPFQITSVTSTNNQHAIATGGQVVVPEALVHWTTCRHCAANPIRGTLYACTVCPDYNLCDACNRKRFTDPHAVAAHPHRFDFHVMPRANNPPPTQAGGGGGTGVPAQAMAMNQYHGPPPQQTYQPGCTGQQAYEAPPMPHYDEYHHQSTLGSVMNWLGRH